MKKKKKKKKRFVFLLSTKKKKTSTMMERCSLVLPSQSFRLPSSQTLVAVGGDPALVDDVDTFFFAHFCFEEKRLNFFFLHFSLSSSISDY